MSSAGTSATGLDRDVTHERLQSGILLERLQNQRCCRTMGAGVPAVQRDHDPHRPPNVGGLLLFGSNFFEGQSESVRVADNYSDMAVRDMDEISRA